MSEKVKVAFIRRYGIYNEGEVAGFDHDRAEELVRLGMATKVGAASDEPAAPSPKPPSDKPADGSPPAAITTSLASVVKQG